MRDLWDYESQRGGADDQQGLHESVHAAAARRSEEAGDYPDWHACSNRCQSTSYVRIKYHFTVKYGKINIDFCLFL